MDLQTKYQIFCDGNFLMIDGDALPYMFGWVHRTHTEVTEMDRALDSWFEDLKLLSGAKTYVGVLAHPEAQCFRIEEYKFKRYKGSRTDKEQDPGMAFWMPYVKGILLEKYGFIHAPQHVETDDVIAYLGTELSIESPDGYIGWMASPDKDMKQIAGYHLDYRKMIDGGGIKNEIITKDQATLHWCMQMLCGDSTDTIAGIPGTGEKKAADLLAKGTPFTWRAQVQEAYQKYFGSYYGDIIYDETYAAVTLMHPGNKYWSVHSYPLESYLCSVHQFK